MYRIFLLGLAFLLCQPLLFTQDNPKETPKPTAGLMFASVEQLANLKLDLLLQQKLTLEAKAQALNFQQELWYRSREDLQKVLNRDFGCDYDMDARKCKPKPEEPKEK